MQNVEPMQQVQDKQRVQETSSTNHNTRPYLIAGILLGLGLGGFFDGIVLHQILQWHHMITVDYPATTLENLELNTLMDGFFHAATYIFTVVGLLKLWRAVRQTNLRPSTGMMIGAMLMGWGLFNSLEGIVDHHLLDIHHVNETVPREQWIYWDLGFLAWGAIMLIGGWMLIRTQAQEQKP
jgi:uncharacterized membrane protein